MGGGASKHRDAERKTSPEAKTTNSSKSLRQNDARGESVTESSAIKQALRQRNEAGGNFTNASYSSDGRKSGSMSLGGGGGGGGKSSSSQLRDGSNLRLRQRVEALEKRELMNEANFNRQRRGSMEVTGVKESLARQAEASGPPDLRRANSVQNAHLRRTSSLSSRIHGPLERQRSAADRSTFQGGPAMASRNSSLRSSGANSNHSMLLHNAGDSSSQRNVLVRTSSSGGTYQNVQQPPVESQQAYLRSRVAQLDDQIAKTKDEQTVLLNSIQNAVNGSGARPDPTYIQILQQQIQQQNQLIDSLFKQRAQVEQTILYMMRTSVATLPQQAQMHSPRGENSAAIPSQDINHSFYDPGAFSPAKKDNSESKIESSSLLFF